MSPDPLRLDSYSGKSYLDNYLDQYRLSPNEFPTNPLLGGMEGGYAPSGTSFEGPVIHNPRSYNSGLREEYIYATRERQTLGEAFASGFLYLGDTLNSASGYVIDRMSDVGGWWKGIKADSFGFGESLGPLSNGAETVNPVYKGYLDYAANKIQSSDELPTLKEAYSRIPTQMLNARGLYSGLEFGGKVLNGVTGGLDVAEAIHDEGGKPGAKTITAVSKSVAQTTLGYVAGAGIAQLLGAGLGALGVSVGAPVVIVGGGVGLLVAYGSGRALDYLAGK